MFLTQSTLVNPSSNSTKHSSSPIPMPPPSERSSSTTVPSSTTATTKTAHTCNWEIYACCRETLSRSKATVVHRSNDVVCGKSFSSRSALLQHLQQEHTSPIALERCHQCHWLGCTKIFRNSSSYLRRHHFKAHIYQVDESEEVTDFPLASLSPSASPTLLNIPFPNTSPIFPPFNDKEGFSHDSLSPSPSLSSSPAPELSLAVEASSSLSQPTPPNSIPPPATTSVALPPASSESRTLPEEAFNTLEKLPEMMQSIQASISNLASAPSTHALRAVLDRLDTLQDTFNRYNLEWRAHRACAQQQMKDIEIGVQSLKYSTASLHTQKQSSSSSSSQQ